MGKASRLKKLRNLGGSVINKAGNTALKTATKPFEKAVKKLTLEKQIKLAEQMIVLYGIDNFKISFLGEEGLSADIKDLKQAGKSNQEIKDYYWNCPGFQSFWGKLGCEEVLLDAMIEGG